jgi:hypothetical protein
LFALSTGSFVLASIATVLALLVGMVLLEAWGKRLGERHRLRGPASEAGYSAAETAVLGVLGLFVAFTFSGAAGRFEARHQLIADETNAIGTAWRRIDLLPVDRQAEIRDLFRQYVDARLEALRLADRPVGVEAAARSLGLQGPIWTTTIAAARVTGEVAPVTLMVPALNEMFDATTTRTAVVNQHPPPIVYIVLALLALVGAVFVGYRTAGQTHPSMIHTLGFAAVLALVMYLIIELEIPHLGLIRPQATDQLLIDLRRLMG